MTMPLVDSTNVPPATLEDKNKAFNTTETNRFVRTLNINLARSIEDVGSILNQTKSKFPAASDVVLCRDYSDVLEVRLFRSDAHGVSLWGCSVKITTCFMFFGLLTSSSEV